jgi:hypothetical protein
MTRLLYISLHDSNNPNKICLWNTSPVHGKTPTRCVVKHKWPCMRQIPKVAIIITTQDQSKNVKIQGTNKKVLSQRPCIWNTKAILLTIQQIWTMYFKFQGQGLGQRVEIGRSCHKEYTCEMWKSYHLPIKRNGQCKFLKSWSNFKVKVRR